MKAIKPDITETLVDAYWTTLDIPNKTDGLGAYRESVVSKRTSSLIVDLKRFNELLVNLNFDLRQRSADQTILQRTFPRIYTSKPSRILIDFVDTG